MISTDLKKVKLQSIVENQLPSFVQSDFPLLGEFLREYYISQEYPTASATVLQNIDEYVKLVTLTTNSDSTVLRDDIDEADEEIFVSFDLNNGVIGTYEFPDKYGLIKIDNEIILYEEKTSNSFKGCIRGFSGVTSYNSIHSDQLSFSESNIAQHITGAKIVNLSALLFARFLIKVKGLYSPGFENRQLDEDLNQRLFVSRVRDFYTSKGSDESFRILFGALYGEDCEVLRPREFLFRPSDADYRVTKDLVVESINGDPSKLLNCTLFQDEYKSYGIEKAYAPITNIEKITFNETDDGRYLIVLNGLTRFKIIKEIQNEKKYRECEVSFDDFQNDIQMNKEEIKFSDLKLIFKDLKTLFQKKGYLINWNDLEKQSLEQTINALAMAIR